MKRLALTLILPLALSACMPAAAPEPTPEEAAGVVSTLRPASAPFPPEVLRAMPAGVSLSSLQIDAANCYFYDTGSGPQPIMTTTTSGSQPFCGVA